MADFEPTGAISVNYTVKELIAQVISRLDNLDSKWDRTAEHLRTTKAEHLDVVLLTKDLEKLKKETAEKASNYHLATIDQRLAELERDKAQEEGARSRSIKVAIAFGTIGALVSIGNFIIAHVH